jgi:hypothetical protein
MFDFHPNMQSLDFHRAPPQQFFVGSAAWPTPAWLIC